tara:strand:+ start:288 stop:437 length:150 start_codon:yes stop_codon:yes gene_type:complete
MAKKKKVTLDDRIESLKAQQEEHRIAFFKLQGAIEGYEILKQEKDEKTD